MKTKKKKIAIVVALIGATALIITSIIGLFGKSGSGKVKVKQQSESGNNGHAGGDVNQAGRDINKADSGGTVSTNTEAPIININQSGGVSARTVIINNAFQVSVEASKTPVEKNKNYKSWIDTASKIIYFQPKSGSWENPFAGIPKVEYEKVQPRLVNQASNVSQKSKTDFQVGTDNLWAREAVGVPSTENFYYGLKYKEMPTYLIFGGYPDVLYKVDLTALIKK